VYVSPLPLAVWEAGKVQCGVGLCHHCVMGEHCQDEVLLCVESTKVVGDKSFILEFSVELT
jgi:hypothetical protein